MIVKADTGEVKMRLPASRITTKADYSLWCDGNPILGLGDQQEVRATILALVKAKKWDEIPVDFYTRLGDNPSGLWAGYNDEWDKHPLKTEQDKLTKIKAAEEAAEAAKRVSIHLSSRGWGDYSPCEWRGDITRPDAEILVECKHALTTGHDVDFANQSDDEILAKITKARAGYESAPARKAAREAAEAADIASKVASGYCFACGTWCHGDCGHYSSDPQVMYRRQYSEAVREANYGIGEGA